MGCLMNDVFFIAVIQLIVSNDLTSLPDYKNKYHFPSFSASKPDRDHQRSLYFCYTMTRIQAIL